MSENLWDDLEDPWEHSTTAMLEIPVMAPAPTLRSCMRFLAGHDMDHARVVNGVGFNKFDGDRGHRLAESDDWSAWDYWWAWEKVQLYHRQFEDAGIEWHRVPKPPKPERDEPIKTCERSDSGFTLIFKNLAAPEYQAIVADAREIPNRMWKSGSEIFIPMDAPAIRAFLPFAKKHGFEVSDETVQEMREMFLYADLMVDASAAQKLPDGVTYDLKIKENVRGNKWPRGFQIAGVWYIEQATKMRRLHNGSKGNGVLIADDMGLGKTLETLLALEQLMTEEDWKRGVLIVVPNAVKLNWLDEINDWLPHRTVSVIRGGYAQPIRANIIIVNYDILRYKWSEEEQVLVPNDLLETMLMKAEIRPYYAIVGDECHKMKSEDAMRTKAVTDLVKAHKPPLLLFLSGSPVLNRADEYTPQLGMLGMLEDFGGASRFETTAASFPKEVNEKFRGKGFLRRQKEDEIHDATGYLVRKDSLPRFLQQSAFEDRTEWLENIRKRGYNVLEGVLHELPAKLRAVHLLEIDNRKEYDKAVKEFQSWLWEQMSGFEDGRERFERAMKAEVLVRIEKLKWLSAKGKMADAKEWITNFLEDSDEKLVVFATHVEFQHSLAEAFPGCAFIRGEDDIDERKRNETKFQTDPACRLIVCSLEAGGIGINLFASSNVAFLELGWGPKIHDQAEDRCHRMGQVGSVTAWYLLADKTIDLSIASLIDQKREIVTQLTDGREAERTHMISVLLDGILAA